MRICYLLGIVMLAGCSTTSAPMWSRSGSSEQEFRSDAKRCETQARIAAAALDDSIQQNRHGTEATRAFFACMREGGWAMNSVSLTGMPETAFKPDDDRCSGMYHRGPDWLECMRRAGWSEQK